MIFAISRTSWLYHLDPRVKLWFAALGVGLALLSGSIPILIAVAILANLVLLAGRVPLRHIVAAWQTLLPLMLLIVIIQPVLVPGDGPPLIEIGPLRITEAGLMAGARYALRLAVAGFSALIPVLTTSINHLVRGLEKLGLSYNIGLTIGLALYYLGTLGSLFDTISEAQQARGLDLSQRGAIKRARALVPSLIALIIASLRLSDSLALGLAARGFGLQQPRTVYRDIRMTRADWLAMLLSAALFAGLLVWWLNFP